MNARVFIQGCVSVGSSYATPINDDVTWTASEVQYLVNNRCIMTYLLTVGLILVNTLLIFSHVIVFDFNLSKISSWSLLSNPLNIIWTTLIMCLSIYWIYVRETWYLILFCILTSDYTVYTTFMLYAQNWMCTPFLRFFAPQFFILIWPYASCKIHQLLIIMTIQLQTIFGLGGPLYTYSWI